MPVQPTPEIVNPAAYVTQHAIAFDDGTGRARPVASAAPLPVTVRAVAAASVPLTGTATVGQSVAGPFSAEPGRAVWVMLAGIFTGSVRVLRSSDGGATKWPLTAGGAAWASFSAACNEPVAEESVAGATYYLACDLTAGTVTYEVAQ